MENPTITRAALGRIASLGDIYDARKDDFIRIPIFKKKIPSDCLTSTDNHFADIVFIHSDTFTEKFSKLDVRAELQVSVLCGLLTLEGAGCYLSDEKTSARSVKSSLLYNLKTKEESLNVYHEELKEAYSIDAILSGIGTHLVVGISWGANCLLSCEYRNVEAKDNKEIEGSLTAQLRKASLAISGQAGVQFTNVDQDINFDIRIFGDVLPQNEDLPTTIEGGINLMKQMPTLLENCNQGRGKPLSYRLFPISSLTKYLNCQIQPDSMIKVLEEDCLLRIVHLFEDMSKTRQELADFYQDAVDNKVCLVPEDLSSITNFKREFAVDEIKFRKTMSTTLTAIRSGKTDVVALEELIDQYKSCNFSPVNFSSQLTKWEHIIRKIAFTKSLRAFGAKYIGFGKSLDDEILRHFESKIFVLYFKESAKIQFMNVWTENRQLFLKEMKKGGCKYFAVDCDVHPDLWPAIGISIQVFVNGTCVTENLLADPDFVVEKCCAENDDQLPLENSTTNL
ncbi:neoverrucotoxin subunit alpha-like [Bradysia coprophila]|uniref:neoverrucotoxin subunit alpha-like n=1 Tax=Bradysia coprophila TaxID=38358 RepID=UPI00187D8647|nr:neoverrucotoxin subunit alpha-like [Bradysia coprophila]